MQGRRYRDSRSPGALRRITRRGTNLGDRHRALTPDWPPKGEGETQSHGTNSGSRRRYTSSMDLTDRITLNPEQCGGRPCIRGMRIRVIDILEMLAAGMSEAEILADYDYLERDDIRASLQYAARPHPPAPSPTGSPPEGEGERLVVRERTFGGVTSRAHSGARLRSSAGVAAGRPGAEVWGSPFPRPHWGARTASVTSPGCASPSSP
jgi:uncharacterized protein (DUF433 family)